MNRLGSTDAALWRPGVTRGQLMRAAHGLEEIAGSCAGRRREELLEMAESLRTRAWTGRPDPDGPPARRGPGLRAL